MLLLFLNFSLLTEVIAEVVKAMLCIRVTDVRSDATRCNRLTILGLIVLVNRASKNVGWMPERDSDSENEHVEL